MLTLFPISVTAVVLLLQQVVSGVPARTKSYGYDRVDQPVRTYRTAMVFFHFEDEPQPKESMDEMLERSIGGEDGLVHSLKVNFRGLYQLRGLRLGQCASARGQQR